MFVRSGVVYAAPDFALLQDHHGDLRPMAGNREAMDDLKGILAGRAAFYSKAEFRLDTSAAPLQPTFEALRVLSRKALGLGDETSAAPMQENA